MASKYDKINPWTEKLKRLYNCPSISEMDLMYLNYQYERYKTRSFHIVSLSGFTLFGVSAIARRMSPSPTKYYATCLGVTFAFWQFMTMKNNRIIST